MKTRDAEDRRQIDPDKGLTGRGVIVITLLGVLTVALVLQAVTLY
jgi:hypothetical protein